MWTRTETGWEAASSQPFPDEATLQSLIMETLQLLPLEGSPSLAVLGSSVRLGDEQAGIFAVESTGRPTIIETNVSDPESRGSILAQAFSFAAFLKGSTVRSLESGALKKTSQGPRLPLYTGSGPGPDQPGGRGRDLRNLAPKVSQQGRPQVRHGARRSPGKAGADHRLPRRNDGVSTDHRPHSHQDPRGEREADSHAAAHHARRVIEIRQGHTVKPRVSLV